MSAAPIQPVAFVAASPEEAVAQIRTQLGPDAVVVNVRPLPASGLGRLWQKPKIEVMAYRPEPEPEPEAPPPPSPAPELTETLAEFRHELEQIRQRVELNGQTGRADGFLERTGLLPQHAQTILDRIQADFGDAPPPSLAAEIAQARATLEKMWRAPAVIPQRSLHVLVGPPAAGKTTCICKWLTQAAMVEGRLARVWRLDGATANMAEALSVYCEILGVPCERAWSGGDAAIAEDIAFIDVPGIDWRNPLAVEELAARWPRGGGAHLHLVLNAAYDISILLAQTRAFSSLPIEDLILTHLDEETRWGKIWNLALGTPYPIRFLSAGVNVPGDFRPATAGMILARQFARK